MQYKNSVFGFAKDLVPLVANGTRVFTYRYSTKYDFLHVGDSVVIEDSSTHLPFAEIEILGKKTCLFRDLPIDRKGHEVYESKESERQTLEQYYHTSISDDAEFFVFEFKVLRLISE